METVRPDEVFDPKDEGNAETIRRGVIIGPTPETIGFGNGVYTRLHGIYQIDIWIPRDLQNAFKIASQYSDAHVVQFWPTTGRGLTLTENSTSAHIVKRPSQRHFGRDGAYLRDMIEVDFYTDESPSA
jgi:hypothetical protein